MKIFGQALLSLKAFCGRGRRRPPPGFVRLAEIVPQIRQDIRYASANNFTGRKVPGYGAPDCWLRREVADALKAAAEAAMAEGFSLIVYDCYRPQRATRAFIAWANDPADQEMKADYYPDLDKCEIFPRGYIAKESMHSLGVAVDIAFVGKDFGTDFDRFDEASAAAYPQISDEARQNRDRLYALMVKHGFENLPQEWWHFNYRGGEDGLADLKPLDVEIG